MRAIYLPILLVPLTLSGLASAESQQIRCAGNDTLRVADVTIAVEGIAVEASGNCELELRNVTLSSSRSAAIEATGNATVTVIGGTITGTPAIDALGKAMVYLEDTQTEGPIYRLGKAYIGARPDGTETASSLGTRRPSTSSSVDIGGLSLDVVVDGAVIRLSNTAGESEPPVPEPGTFELETVIADLGAQQTNGDWTITLKDTVLFDFDASDIQPEGADTLAKLAYLIREKAASEAVIVGHTDSKGTPEYNQALSERRALAVVVWLHTNGGIPLDRLAGRGAGEAEPVAPNTQENGKDNPVGRALNRRVEISFAER